VGNHHVVTGHHDAPASNPIRLVIPDVGNKHLAGRIRIASVLYINYGTIEPEPNCIAGFVQLGIIKSGQQNFFSVIANANIGNHLFH